MNLDASLLLSPRVRALVLVMLVGWILAPPAFAQDGAGSEPATTASESGGDDEASGTEGSGDDADPRPVPEGRWGIGRPPGPSDATETEEEGRRNVFSLTESIRDWVPVARSASLPETDRPMSTGAAWIEDNEGNRLIVGLIGQLQYDYRLNNVDQERTEDDTLQTFSLRRLRWFITAQTADDSLRMHIQINTTPGEVELFDAIMAWDVTPGYSLMLGAQKLPFSLYRLMSTFDLLQADWSIGARMFGGERQWGLAISKLSAGRMTWRAGVYDGSNRRRTHGLGPGLFYRREFPNPSRFGVGDAPIDIHPEVGGLIAYSGPNGHPGMRPDADGRFRWRLAASGMYDLNPGVRVDFSTRLSLEFFATWKRWGTRLTSFHAWMRAEQGPYAPVHGGVAELFVRPVDRLDLSLIGAVTRPVQGLLDRMDRDLAPEGLTADWRFRTESTFAVRTHIYPNSVTMTLDTSMLTDRVIDEFGGPERLRLDWRTRALMQFAF